MNKKIHVAFSIHDITNNYSKYVATAMISVFLNTKQSVEIHLLHDETLSKDNMNKFMLLADRYKHKISFYNVELPENVKKCKTINSFSPASLYRIFISELLPELEKIIYLDGDIISFLDIQELWNINIDDFLLAAVKDKVIDGIKYNEFSKNEFFNRNHILNDKYFNAGVLLLNLKKIREMYDLKKECFYFLEKNPDAPALDQECLNFLFQNNCFFLDKKFNLSPEEASKSILKNEKNMNCILHFYTWDKPWKTNTYSFNKFYWEYFNKTPWGENIGDFINTVMKITPALDEGIIFQPIRSRKKFVKNFCRRLWIEVKLKFFKRI